MRARRTPERASWWRPSVAAVCCGLAALSCGDDGEPAEPDEGACEGRADAYEPGLRKLTDDDALEVELSEADPAPPASADAIWTLRLWDADGAPATGASIVALPYMVDHGHAAPTRVAEELGDGAYEIGPLGLIMPGLWTVTLRVAPAGGEATDAVFQFCIGG